MGVEREELYFQSDGGSGAGNWSDGGGRPSTELYFQSDGGGRPSLELYFQSDGASGGGRPSRGSRVSCLQESVTECSGAALLQVSIVWSLVSFCLLSGLLVPRQAFSFASQKIVEQLPAKFFLRPLAPFNSDHLTGLESAAAAPSRSWSCPGRNAGCR